MPNDAGLAGKLGPVLMGTVVCSELERCAQAYCRWLRMRIEHRGELSPAMAAHWAAPALAGCPYAVLGSAGGTQWLRLVEDPLAPARAALRSHGWMSMEVLVSDVSALAEELADSPFTVLAPPAPLDVSDAICAMQLLGPAGEVLYLTEVRGEVPPFELPRAVCEVDRLFIPVLSAADRAASLAFYERLAGRSGLSFDTRLGVVNRARGLRAEQRHPVATLQLPDQSLIEIDQLPACDPGNCREGGMPAGLAMVTFACLRDSAAPSAWARLAEPPCCGRASSVIFGVGGERVELLEPA